MTEWLFFRLLGDKSPFSQHNLQGDANDRDEETAGVQYLAEIAKFLGITTTVHTEAIQGGGSYEDRTEVLRLIVDLVEASLYADNPEWSVDEQVAKDIQPVDSIAEKTATIFSEACKLSPAADVQIQSIYPMPNISELESKVPEQSKILSNLQQKFEDLASKHAYNPDEEYADVESQLRAHLKSFLETAKSFNTIYTKVKIVNHVSTSAVRISRRDVLCINTVNPNGVDETKHYRLPRVKAYGGFSGHFQDHVVESCGELFYIVITFECHFLRDIANVEVFKWDQVRLIWTKVREVGDRVCLSSGRDRYSISSLGVTHENRGGFLYYFSSRCLYSYSFADMSVSTYLLSSLWNLPGRFYEPVLYLPDRRLIGGVMTQQYYVDRKKIREGTGINKIGSIIKYEKESLLLCCPDDVIKSITRFLNPVDYLNFRSLSRTGRRLAPRSELRNTPIHLTYAASPLSPWFISFDKHTGVLRFVDSKLGGEFLMNIPETLWDAKIHHSNDGWLLMSMPNQSLILYHPFTKEILRLPRLKTIKTSSFGSWSIGFSSSPTSSECWVAAINGGSVKISVHIFQIKQWRWDSFLFLDDKLFSYRCPVFHDEACYVLGDSGELRVFEFQSDEYPDLVRADKEMTGNLDAQKFLLVLNGRILSVLIGEEGNWVKVFSLKHSSMSWEIVNGLENHTLYLSKVSSFSSPAGADWMKNIIFLPRVHDNSIVYYSMDRQSYHTLADRENDVLEFSNTRELLVAGWIKPLMQ